MSDSSLDALIAKSNATLERMEPGVTAISEGTSLASIAISLKRIADGLEALGVAAQPFIAEALIGLAEAKAERSGG